jgi:hypothetical protein
MLSTRTKCRLCRWCCARLKRFTKIKCACFFECDVNTWKLPFTKMNHFPVIRGQQVNGDFGKTFINSILSSSSKLWSLSTTVWTSLTMSLPRALSRSFHSKGASLLTASYNASAHSNGHAGGSAQAAPLAHKCPNLSGRHRKRKWKDTSCNRIPCYPCKGSPVSGSSLPQGLEEMHAATEPIADAEDGGVRYCHGARLSGQDRHGFENST